LAGRQPSPFIGDDPNDQDGFRLSGKGAAMELSGLLFLFLLAGCNFVSREEILRVESPDSVVEAVLVRTNAGATTAYGYFLYIVPKGKPVSEKTEVLRADHAEDMAILWGAPKELHVFPKEARIFHFRNVWISKEVNNFEYVVHLKLINSAPFRVWVGDN
jgi:hypothetical protein